MVERKEEMLVIGIEKNKYLQVVDEELLEAIWADVTGLGS